jgi:hypothetical protein
MKQRSAFRWPALAAALLAGCARTAAPPTGAAGQQEMPSPEPAFTLPAGQLAREYEADRASADDRYKGRWLAVEGPVDDVDLFASGRTVVCVREPAGAGKKPGRGLRCAFVPAAAVRLDDVSRGQVIKFKGRCEGEAGGTFVDLADCELLEVGPDPALPVSAARLTRDYASDPRAADVKYAGHPLLVEGTVLEVRPTGEGPRLVLEGFDEKALYPVRVVAGCPADRKEEFAGLKKGDKVLVKGFGGGNVLGEVVLSAARRVR